jgi:exopolysaccharide biosynthesis predicted pyruvyltransferase EpsI
MTNITIKQYLKTLPTDGSVYYCPDLGNAGDSLIAQATLQLFAEVGVNFTFVHWEQLEDFNPEGKTLIYGGGGNLVSYYKVARNILEKYHRYVDKMVIFPHTITDNEDLLPKLANNVDIILREEVSYAHVLKNNTQSNIMLMDDLAFSLNIHDVLNKQPIGTIAAILLKIRNKFKPGGGSTTIPSIEQMLSNDILDTSYRLKRLFNSHGARTLNCFRTDVEETGVELPKDNLDLSDIFAYGTRNEELIHYASHRLLSFINHFDVVKTNRLHVCLAGALLGKQVKFYPNSYWKCEAIYNYSIKNKFDNVEWCT